MNNIFSTATVHTTKLKEQMETQTGRDEEELGFYTCIILLASRHRNFPAGYGSDGQT